MKKMLMGIWVAMALAGCGQQNNLQNEAVQKSPVHQSANVQTTQTFDKQVFKFADAFNADMRGKGMSFAIPGAGIKDEVLQGVTSKLSVINPAIQINWLPNQSNTDIQSILITQTLAESDELDFTAVNSLLVASSGFSDIEKEAFYAELLKNQAKLKEIRKLDNQQLSTTNFEFGGYGWTLALDGTQILYNRVKF